MATSTKTPGSRRTNVEPRAASARYDDAGKRVLVELTSGFLFGIPLAQLPEIASAPRSSLAAVEVIGAGNILHWESLDADYSVPALLVSAMGSVRAAKEFARMGGRARTDAKAAASRANGKKGGRPRKERPAAR
jgi:hypothetical protein